MIHKKQLDILTSDKTLKLYEGDRGTCNHFITIERVELLRQSFTPIKFKELYLNEYSPHQE